jgi:hypothetical protein
MRDAGFFSTEFADPHVNQYMILEEKYLVKGALITSWLVNRNGS